MGTNLLNQRPKHPPLRPRQPHPLKSNPRRLTAPHQRTNIEGLRRGNPARNLRFPSPVRDARLRDTQVREPRVEPVSVFVAV